MRIKLNYTGSIEENCLVPDMSQLSESEQEEEYKKADLLATRFFTEIEKKIFAEYPGCDIDVTIQRDVFGQLDHSVDTEDELEILDRIDTIENQLLDEICENE